ncbi:hypothetical protein CONLIGDRAFT_98692 [Coniochaeta ligniaria NRRL 30616]|uniref:Uncharacterized protein n=1 Tax=Coniochaeta ligniaria NRRL 30616 TaxID=1408157 RepID=A0A1J7IAK9_9PEZI|nr:hypothetical protein CONLIGDRAFT_98692 [Coniochaeta ligniaria NRRL 30616]
MVITRQPTYGVMADLDEGHSVPSSDGGELMPCLPYLMLPSLRISAACLAAMAVSIFLYIT